MIGVLDAFQAVEDLVELHRCSNLGRVEESRREIDAFERVLDPAGARLSDPLEEGEECVPRRFQPLFRGWCRALGILAVLSLPTGLIVLSERDRGGESQRCDGQ